jgi:hypothetical protein
MARGGKQLPMPIVKSNGSAAEPQCVARSHEEGGTGMERVMAGSRGAVCLSSLVALVALSGGFSYELKE